MDKTILRLKQSERVAQFSCQARNKLLNNFFASVFIFSFVFLASKTVLAQSFAQANLLAQNLAGTSNFFNIGLKRGDSHPQVKLLQQFLNLNGYTVADWGVGSRGSETELFGVQTEKALKTFQCAQGISCSGSPETNGYGTVGPATRAKLNSLVASGASLGMSVGFPTNSQVLQATTGPTFAEKVNSELEALVNGPGKGQFYIYENNANTLLGALKPNPNSWTNKLDFTGVMTWQNEWGDARKVGTLIAPQYMIQAKHFPLAVGFKVRFADKNGATVERQVVDFRDIPNSDIRITKLDLPLRAERFKTYKVFASKDEFIAKTHFEDIPLVGGNAEGITQNPKYLSVNQDRAVIIHQSQPESVTNSGLWQTMSSGCPVVNSPYSNPNFGTMRTYDSGGPSFIVYNGEPVLVGIISTAAFCSGGPFISNFINPINEAISSMGGVYKLQTVSLESFSNLNHDPEFDNLAELVNIIDINENLPTNSLIKRVVAHDRDAGQLVRFSIENGTGKDLFSINDNGEITVKDGTKLDFESRDLRRLAGIPDNDLTSAPILNLNITIEDNGNPVRKNQLPLNTGLNITGLKIRINDLNDGQSANINESEKSLKLASVGTKQIVGGVPFEISYEVKNWGADKSFNVYIVKYDLSGNFVRAINIGEISIDQLTENKKALVTVPKPLVSNPTVLGEGSNYKIAIIAQGLPGTIQDKLLDTTNKKLVSKNDGYVSLSLNPTIPPVAQTDTNINNTIYTRDLTIGSRGQDVVALQNKLISLGYLSSGNNTGYFGKATKEAVIGFQISKGIYPASGYFGPVTRDFFINKL